MSLNDVERYSVNSSVWTSAGGGKAEPKQNLTGSSFGSCRGVLRLGVRAAVRSLKRRPSDFENWSSQRPVLQAISHRTLFPKSQKTRRWRVDIHELTWMSQLFGVHPPLVEGFLAKSLCLWIVGFQWLLFF